MRASGFVVATILSLFTFSMPALASNVCASNAALKSYVQEYRNCIVEKAVTYEVSGDSPDSIATAALSACSEFRQRIEDHIDLCGGISGASGAEVMRQAAQQYHDFAVQAVLERRANRKALESKLGSPQ